VNFAAGVSVPNAKDFSVTSAESYNFTASYTGDGNNNCVPVGSSHEDFAVVHELELSEYTLVGLAALGACFVGFAVFKKRSSLPHFKRN
jgi:hypothetical protein